MADIKLTNAHILHGNALERLKELPDNSVDSIITDPPYGLSDNKHVADTIVKWVNGERTFIPDGKGFMGKSWDAFVPPPAIWDECYRVLKPGGHMLAFFGTRTQDLGTLAIRLAGFEIRDSIAWLYGSGFPKSLDISKAIDKNNGESNRIIKFVDYMKTTGLTASQVNTVLRSKKIISEKGTVAGHYFSHSQPAIATSEIWTAIRPLITVEIPEWVDQLVDRIEAEREVVGKYETDMGGLGGERLGSAGGDITASATDAAKQYEGWGTALKPAHEPITVARKPLSESTVANNVLKWGTGGLNIDESRIGSDTIITQVGKKGGVAYGDWNEKINLPHTGRFPANIMLDEKAAAMLDEQSGALTSGGGNKATKNANTFLGTGFGGTDDTVWMKDTGGASRFFYVAKASKKDRNEGVDDITGKEIGAKGNGLARTCQTCGASILNPCECPDRTYVNPVRQNFHPTVKPTNLMEYLIKLVTPFGGTVLDPFTGSGSTGKAALLNGFKFIGCEMTEEYLPIIEGRLKFAENKHNEVNETDGEVLF